MKMRARGISCVTGIPDPVPRLDRLAEMKNGFRQMEIEMFKLFPIPFPLDHRKSPFRSKAWPRSSNHAPPTGQYRRPYGTCEIGSSMPPSPPKTSRRPHHGRDAVPEPLRNGPINFDLVKVRDQRDRFGHRINRPKPNNKERRKPQKRRSTTPSFLFTLGFNRLNRLHGTMDRLVQPFLKCVEMTRHEMGLFCQRLHFVQNSRNVLLPLLKSVR